jgi:hypothetical protein
MLPFSEAHRRAGKPGPLFRAMRRHGRGGLSQGRDLPVLQNLTDVRDLPSSPWHGSSGSIVQEAQVPTLFRFLFVVAILAGLGFAAMFALATLVNPDPREISVPVQTSRPPSSS